MEIPVSDHGNYVLANTQGVIDESANELFREILHPVVADGKPLMVNLSGSPRINSRGIAALVALTIDANTKGSAVVFVEPAPFVANVLQISRLDTFLSLRDDETAGLQYLDGFQK